jgi:putative redox protein
MWAIGRHRLIADELVSVGGLDGGPDPMVIYLPRWVPARRWRCASVPTAKSLPLRHITIALRHGKIHAADCESCESKEGMVDWIERTITLKGDLNADMSAKLLEIAEKSPVHRTSTSEVDVQTRLTKTS